MDQESGLVEVSMFDNAAAVAVPERITVRQTSYMDTLRVEFVDSHTHDTIMSAYFRGWVDEKFFQNMPKDCQYMYITINGIFGVSVEVGCSGKRYSRKTALEIPRLEGTPIACLLECNENTKEEQEIADRVISSFTPRSGAHYPDDWTRFRAN
jgi:hypothetical protein